MSDIRNVNIATQRPVPSPRDIKSGLVPSGAAEARVIATRQTIHDILIGRDKRIFAIVGPCSIHNQEAAFQYAEKIAPVARSIEDEIVLIMRVYGAKPRTTLGWKGYLYDPSMDGGYDIGLGARLMRETILGIVDRGLPIGTEILDPFTVQYFDDLIAWGAIGARTVASQIHRELASALTAPVGLKNATDGSIKDAIDAIETANHPHFFWGMDDNGRVSSMESRGNSGAHIVLRGGTCSPNSDAKSVQKTHQMLVDRGLLDAIVVDCSHGNSGKDPQRQGTVLRHVIQQRLAGDTRLVGVMLESNLVAGRQDIPKDGDLSKLVYGQSVTDACLGFDETELLLLETARYLHRT